MDEGGRLFEAALDPKLLGDETMGAITEYYKQDMACLGRLFNYSWEHVQVPKWHSENASSPVAGSARAEAATGSTAARVAAVAAAAATKAAARAAGAKPNAGPRPRAAWRETVRLLLSTSVDSAEREALVQALRSAQAGVLAARGAAFQAEGSPEARLTATSTARAAAESGSGAPAFAPASTAAAAAAASPGESGASAQAATQAAAEAGIMAVVGAARLKTAKELAARRVEASTAGGHAVGNQEASASKQRRKSYSRGKTRPPRRLRQED